MLKDFECCCFKGFFKSFEKEPALERSLSKLTESIRFRKQDGSNQANEQTKPSDQVVVDHLFE